MKFLASLAAFFLALTPTASAAPTAQEPVRITGDALPSPFFIDLDLIVLILCMRDDGQLYGGTGVYISATELVTADHVVASGACSIGGKPIDVIHRAPDLDFAVVRSPIRSDMRVTISCAGFREGADYYGVGYPGGTNFAVQRFTGSSEKIANGPDKGLAILRGKGFPGQSGGALIDDLGRIVGIVNAGPEDGTPWLYSRPLTDTYLCR